jgi:hypothetical protein
MAVSDCEGLGAETGMPLEKFLLNGLTGGFFDGAYTLNFKRNFNKWFHLGRYTHFSSQWRIDNRYIFALWSSSIRFTKSFLLENQTIY